MREPAGFWRFSLKGKKIVWKSGYITPNVAGTALSRLPASGAVNRRFHRSGTDTGE